MAHGYVQVGPGNENSGVQPAGANINGGDDIYAGFQGSAAATYSTGISGMRARLIALGGVFTAAYVDQLSYNDMAYALRTSGG